MTDTKKILEEFDEKFGFYEIYICADCGHTKEDHYWNGGGYLENSGYDSCRADNCKCISENWKIEKRKKENKAFKDFLAESIDLAVAEERDRLVREARQTLKKEDSDIVERVLSSLDKSTDK